MTTIMQERPFKNLITRSFLEETESQLNKHTKTVATVMKDALQATEKEVEMVTDHHLKDVKAEDHHQAISALHARRRGIGKEIFTHFDEARGEKKEENTNLW